MGSTFRTGISTNKQVMNATLSFLLPDTDMAEVVLVDDHDRRWRS